VTESSNGQQKARNTKPRKPFGSPCAAPRKEVEGHGVAPRKHGEGKEADLGFQTLDAFAGKLAAEAAVPH
jgi:hypothetical protein